MIDAPPTNATPPPEPQRVCMGWHVVPSMWSMGQPKAMIKEQAKRDFNASLVCCAPWLTPSEDCIYSPAAVIGYSHSLRDRVKECEQCAGLLVIRDPSQHIPTSSANVIDFFFGRDGAEALVYEWQPFERNFRLVDRDWLNARRAS